jgi:hypothetical protein
MRDLRGVSSSAIAALLLARSAGRAETEATDKGARPETNA